MATPAINGSSMPAAGACPAEIREILHAAASGEELTFEQGLMLATAEGSAAGWRNGNPNAANSALKEFQHAPIDQQ